MLILMSQLLDQFIQSSSLQSSRNRRLSVRNVWLAGGVGAFTSLWDVAEVIYLILFHFDRSGLHKLLVHIYWRLRTRIQQIEIKFLHMWRHLDRCHILWRIRRHITVFLVTTFLTIAHGLGLGNRLAILKKHWDVRTWFLGSTALRNHILLLLDLRLAVHCVLLELWRLQWQFILL